MVGSMDGKVVVITGAASGIGLACAQRFAADGATVVGSDLNSLDGFPGELVTVDVTDADAQAAHIAQVAETHGRIDVVVTAAGVAGGGPLHLIDIEEWDRVQNINLRGTMLTIRAALEPMIKQRSGSIITIASVEGLEGCEAGSTYNASKGGVVLLTKNLANDYGRIGIRANCICPGFIDTPLLRGVLDALPFREDIIAQHKLGRLGKPEEIAGAARFLAGDDASFVTGVALPVDGGYTAGHSYGIAEMMGLS